MLEWADVHGELYGTPRENLQNAVSEGVHLLLDIDVQGARAVKAAVPEALTIFLLPPSGAWLSRLRSRGSESGAGLERRLGTAKAELVAAEEFEYVIINGTPVLERGKYRADALAGRVLRAPPGQ